MTSKINIVRKILFEIESEFGHNQTQVAENLGVEKQTISSWISRNKISKKGKIALVDAYSVNNEYIETGDGSVFSYQLMQKEPSQKPKRSVKSIDEGEIARQMSFERDPMANITHIPIEAEAGFLGGGILGVMKEDLVHYHLPNFRGEGYSFQIKGDSMEATLRAGDILITNKEPIRNYDDIRSDYIYAVETRDGLLVKRVIKHAEKYMLWLMSDNEDYEMIEIHFDDIINIYMGRRIISHNLSQKLRYEEV